MARFDVYRLRTRGRLVLDCQSDLPTRFVIPLLPVSTVPRRIDRLHPVLSFAGDRLVLATHFAVSIDSGELRSRLGSLAHEHFQIMRAIDALVSDP